QSSSGKYCLHTVQFQDGPSCCSLSSEKQPHKFHYFSKTGTAVSCRPRSGKSAEESPTGRIFPSSSHLQSDPCGTDERLPLQLFQSASDIPFLSFYSAF